MRRKLKFWLLFVLGACIFIPFFLLSLSSQVLLGVISIHGALFSLGFLGPFIIYCYLLYRFVYKRAKPKYPIVPPEGRSDIYFPRTDIPRPIFEDARRYPKYFKRRKKSERREKVRKKK